ncbi:hypothetical protein CCYN74_110145 [Capnocytophaga cynodegmi]|uniref:Uncharacterized protein n=1 Tax=Capnocytophaga cynodegmi TaxID=28189 RepID=A0A0B7H9C2_9FLAO|nr:hypothetical protein CCYN74_110145 [Capnocytophaga cynodegmi]
MPRLSAGLFLKKKPRLVTYYKVSNLGYQNLLFALFTQKAERLR